MGVSQCPGRGPREVCPVGLEEGEQGGPGVLSRCLWKVSVDSSEWPSSGLPFVRGGWTFAAFPTAHQLCTLTHNPGRRLDPPPPHHAGFGLETAFFSPDTLQPPSVCTSVWETQVQIPTMLGALCSQADPPSVLLCPPHVPNEAPRPLSPEVPSEVKCGRAFPRPGCGARGQACGCPLWPALLPSALKLMP